MRPLPTGTITFLFSDVEGSTKLVQALGPQRWTVVLDTHQRLLRDAFRGNGGIEIKTEGDSFFVVFAGAASAVAAAAAAQRALHDATWPPEVGELRVRIGLHTGEGILGADDYVGLDVHRAARIAAAAHGGQVVVSSALRGLVEDALPEGVRLRELGTFRLKDLGRPETISQLDIDGLPSDFPPLRTLDTPTNLPAPMTSFIGRAREIAELVALLRDGTTRLVTLTGPGGSGKTRLSLAVALTLLGDFPDGVFFVGLAAIEDPELLAPTIAVALGLKETPGQPMDRTLRDHLAGRRALLVLDNLEQLAAAWPRVAELLSGAPRLAVLASSREVLHLAGEREYPVMPLPYPGAIAVGIGIDALSVYDAVALFIARAQAVRPDFAASNENAPAIAQICSRLDGLPLAIELAAARVKLFEPEAILARLSKSLGFLTGGSRDVPARQQTLRGAIAWSHDLLAVPERTLFRRLAVFVGGWSFAAAEAVCDPDGSLGIELLEGLASLVDKSLVTRAAGAAGEARFRFLVTIREFALERLEESPDAEAVREVHARHFLGLAEAAGPYLLSGVTDRGVEALVHDEDNLREAIRWSLASGRAEVGLRIIGAAWRFWQERSSLAEGLTWAVQLLAHPAAQAPTAARAMGLDGAGGLAYWLGDFETAAAYYDECLAIAESLAAAGLQASAHYGLGFIAMTRGDSRAVRHHEEASIELYGRLGDSDGQARAGMPLVIGLLLEHEYGAARTEAQESVRRFREGGALVALTDALTMLSAIEVQLDDPAAARRLAAEALHLRESRGGRGRLLGSLQMTAIIALAGGQPDRAAVLAGAVDALRAEAQVMLPPVRILRFEDPAVAARSGLGDAPFEAAWARGRELTLAEAVAYASEVLATS
ncbi:MAG: adenylate/guanylate cyclase domain-containing protein [Candidatus Limnocylindrales bacterium]